ncbi:MAG: DUF1016 N-terminal domain-containing protein [Planctomyces sp.]
MNVFNKGLTSTCNRFHDSHEKSPEILKLRELHEAMDRAALEACGWHDVAQTARCKFLLDCEDDYEAALTTNSQSPSTRHSRRKKPRDSAGPTTTRPGNPERNAGRRGRLKGSRDWSLKMAKKKSQPVKLTKRPAKPVPARSLLGDLRQLIEAAREQTARAVNSTLVTMYWQIGKRIREDVLQSQRGESGMEIVSALSAQLTV